MIRLPMADNKNSSPFFQHFTVYKALSKSAESSSEPYEIKVSKPILQSVNRGSDWGRGVNEVHIRQPVSVRARTALRPG